ncbi:MAG TPA: 2TM domain-containing protein [Ktedonobacterales bacterium]
MQTAPTIPPMTPSMTPLRPSVQEPHGLDPEQQRREQAIKRIQDTDAFKAHLVAYLIINALFVVIWAMSGVGFFWPLYTMLAWGAGVAVHGYCVYGGNDTNAFKVHLAAYLVINAWLVVMWAIMGAGFFWPICVMLAWGAGVAIHGYSVYGGGKMTEAQIEREMKRLP